MSHSHKGVPEGFHAITPHLVCKNAGEAIDFYEKALGATIVSRDYTPDGKSIVHSDLLIGNSHFSVNEEFAGMKSPRGLGGSPVTFQIYCEDADALYQRAVSAGATINMELQDMLLGRPLRPGYRSVRS